MGKWVYIPDDDEIKILVASKITELKEALEDDAEMFNPDTYGEKFCLEIVDEAREIEKLNNGLLELPEWLTAMSGSVPGRERYAVIYAIEILMEEV
jgi:hypothetical protein